MPLHQAAAATAAAAPAAAVAAALTTCSQCPARIMVSWAGSPRHPSIRIQPLACQLDISSYIPFTLSAPHACPSLQGRSSRAA